MNLPGESPVKRSGIKGKVFQRKALDRNLLVNIFYKLLNNVINYMYTASSVGRGGEKASRNMSTTKKVVGVTPFV